MAWLAFETNMENTFGNGRIQMAYVLARTWQEQTRGQWLL